MTHVAHSSFITVTCWTCMGIKVFLYRKYIGCFGQRFNTILWAHNQAWTFLKIINTQWRGKTGCAWRWQNVVWPCTIITNRFWRITSHKDCTCMTNLLTHQFSVIQTKFQMLRRNLIDQLYRFCTVFNQNQCTTVLNWSTGDFGFW